MSEMLKEFIESSRMDVVEHNGLVDPETVKELKEFSKTPPCNITITAHKGLGKKRQN